MAKSAKITAAAVGNGSISYLGQHHRGVDNGRIIIPVDWRPARSDNDFMGILWPFATPLYLLVLTPSRWEALQKNLECNSLADENAAMIERSISSNTLKMSVDSYGRLPLPEGAVKTLGIESEAMLIGRFNKFEVWNPSQYAATLANTDAQLIANALKAIKI